MRETEQQKLTIKSDVSKCPGEGCELRNNCLRYLRPAGKYQRMAQFNPETCDGFQPHSDFVNKGGIVHITMEVE